MKPVPALLLTAILFAACGDDRVAGTSSGVDNPALTVAFVDAGGAAVRITGELNVYAQDQNPAVDAEPLATIKVKNSAFTNLTGADFARLREGASKKGAAASAKRAAGAATASISDGADTADIPFNLILKTQDRNGSLMMGFSYGNASKAFSRAGGALSRVDVRPKPLVRYQAKVALDSLKGAGTGRVFLPGTPYLAALVNGAFIIEDLPEGVFPIRLLAGDGKVYPIHDSLDTRDSALIFHPSSQPVGSVDTAGRDSLPDFSMTAGPDHEAFLELSSYLEAKANGIDPADPRLTIRWKLIDTSDTVLVPKDTVLTKRGADILSPTSLRSEVRFSAEGVYAFEIAASFGARTRYDTVVVSVRRLPSPAKPRIIQPRPGDSLVAERPYNIQWEMPDAGKGFVSIRFSADSGASWINLSTHYAGKDSVTIFPWTPSKSLGISFRCMVQVISEADSTLRAGMDGPFKLLQ